MTVELMRSPVSAEAAVESLRSVATRILRSRELDEALLAVTNETLTLLTSDIAGVLLRDGDEIVMRACAGNQLADTGKLRMRKGQGLAGHIFATGKAAKVDDYLSDEVISDDFNHLARAERTRSALGAPLVVDGQVIGVLEVWRRRESRFTPDDIRSLVALADLAAIALDNARQHEVSRTSRLAAQTAHRALELELGKVRHALSTQQALLEALIAGQTRQGIARLVGELNECEVVVLDGDHRVSAAEVVGIDPLEVAQAVRAPVRRVAPGEPFDVEVGSAPVHVRPVSSGGQSIGWIAVRPHRPTTTRDVLELAATQAAMVLALQHLEEQAAVKARSALREELLVHLLKGAPDERRAAIARARHLQVDLRGPLRVCVCTLTGLREHAVTAAWSPALLEQTRSKLFQAGDEAFAGTGMSRVLSAAGHPIIALVRPSETADPHAALREVSARMSALVPSCRPIWGVSAVRHDALQLDAAYEEATIAAQALRADSHRNVACFEDLGVLALLLAGPQGTALAGFATDTIGPLLAHDERHGTHLLQTLRSYLDNNCNQKDAAGRLFVHQKTVKYRLDTIEKLTGLALDEHRDRMRLDIAVRAHDLR